jgi:hypothetical protein
MVSLCGRKTAVRVVARRRASDPHQTPVVFRPMMANPAHGRSPSSGCMRNRQNRRADATDVYQRVTNQIVRELKKA